MRSMVSAMLVRIVYGIEVDGLHNPNMRIVEAALDAMARGMQPGTYMAEYLPFLDRLPTWLPFTNTQRMFSGWRKATSQLRESFYRQGQEINVSRLCMQRSGMFKLICIRTGQGEA